jgi:hypothetical protein
MIFDSDLVIGAIILIVGMGYWSLSMTEHNNNYVDAVKADYMFDKGITTMEHLSEDGTLQNAVLLYYFGQENASKKLLMDRIPLKNYSLEIDGHMVINKLNINSSSSLYVLAVLTLNRSEGWYVIYGNDSSVSISTERYIDYDDGKSKYANYDIDMPVYLSKDIKGSKIKLYLGNS